MSKILIDEALRLADALDNIHTTHVARKAAEELRRLHAENQVLRQALEQSVAQIDTSAERVEKEAENVHEKPDRQALQAAGIHPAPCARHCEANAFEIAARGMRKQITELQEALAEQPRAEGTLAPAQPLTDEQIDALPLPPSGTATVRDLVRIIEAAHGITSKKD